MSPEFVGTTDGVTESPTPGGISGFVWEDTDGDGEPEIRDPTPYGR